ncbi:hypothetical protein [Sphaerisporangium sp. TRM90804]|uniref:hypothetical protein n=1 Tax=Sphaerisporangium sp. TRM90804 TaxID=3031113 RepID=UPI00244AA42D|nr:hypothetical protein [Sphaerisporangium sp. TRM90804]MDH2424792.1 hypothetical protein [Sphaerisporangium sp. TRM90804]
MQMPDGCRLAYVVAHEAWYGQVLGVVDRPRVWVAAAAGGGVEWEFSVEEVDYGHRAIRVDIFHDAFDAFRQIPEFFAALAEQRTTTLPEVVAILAGMGAVDQTERVRSLH